MDTLRSEEVKIVVRVAGRNVVDNSRVPIPSIIQYILQSDVILFYPRICSSNFTLSYLFTV
jgi:hypothetical protein